MIANVWWLLQFSYFDYSVSFDPGGKPTILDFSSRQEWLKFVTAASFRRPETSLYPVDPRDFRVGRWGVYGEARVLAAVGAWACW